MNVADVNPILKCDYPDPDVIRVKDTYYMASTTMYFMPGGALLRSYDLINWEIASYIFETLDDTPEERLEQERSNYGCGMWAPTLRYHNGVFYAVFTSFQTKKTYCFTTTDVEAKWDKHEIEGYYHDSSLLFDDDGRIFLVYGNKEIHLLELNEELTAPKEGGIDKIILKEPKEYEGLGFEGSHFYKINGKYYLFNIHWPAGERRIETCYMSDRVDGEYTGGAVFDCDRDYCNQGVAQGGIVDTPYGKWYAVLFQDSGAVGRIPVLVPVNWEGDRPVFGINGTIPKRMEIASSRPYYRYEPLFTSDDFNYEGGRNPELKKQWQWNHTPNKDLWAIIPGGGGLYIKTKKICANLTYAVNTLTQRMMFPKCEAEVTIDASGIKEGDIAGLCALQSNYGFLGITKNAGNYYLVRMEKNAENTMKIGASDYLPGDLIEKIKLNDSKVTVCLKPNFENMQDKLDFFYLKEDGKWTKVGNSHKLFFRLDHFTGCRFGLFIFSTREVGGSAVFSDFIYRYE